MLLRVIKLNVWVIGSINQSSTRKKAEDFEIVRGVGYEPKNKNHNRIKRRLHDGRAAATVWICTCPHRSMFSSKQRGILRTNQRTVPAVCDRWRNVHDFTRTFCIAMMVDTQRSSYMCVLCQLQRRSDWNHLLMVGGV